VSASLDSLTLGDPAQAWERLGFAVAGDELAVGGVRLALAGRSAGEGILSWSLRDLEGDDLGGLLTGRSDRPPPAIAEHPNGATALDHVVVFTPTFEATRDALSAAGLDLRRERDLRDTRMAFFRIGPTILELVENRDAPAARFWGLVVVVPDLDATAALLGDRIGAVRDAVQPGRRIATVRDPEGPSTAVAFMTPR
jgi:hypothetical protein